MAYLALTREITPAFGAGELTYLDRAPVDVDRARAQLDAYESALRVFGCEVERLPADPDMGDAVFIEDTAVVLDELAVITRPGAESRRRETARVADALRLRRPIAALLDPATLDGGDVLPIERTIHVGQSTDGNGRTNDAGRRQLSAMVASQGYRVETVPFSGCLHLKTAVTRVARDAVVLNPRWVSPGAFPGMRVIEVDPDEPFAANALLLDGRVLFPEEFPYTRRRLEEAGIRTMPTPMSELAKAEAGLTCCSLLVRL
ncbi:MAG TPA: N(G),N(G)-dimethylarginine dimethylaminohydrolase [Gemmatimonadaceae bacterium]|jgi:dimethylargininase|nr:N(G),N(G)-dimethylarginine dimethylaminohydrolase [Gemmatimonadaceae bacterium]